MFSRKTVMIVGLVVAITVNIIVLSLSTRHHKEASVPGRIAFAIVAPFQEAVTRSVRFCKNIWEHYFALVSVVEENQILKELISEAVEKTISLSKSSFPTCGCANC